MGFGREGKSTFKLLQDVGSYSKLAISDIKASNFPECENVTFISGENYLDVLDDFDIVFKSPGIVLPKDFCEYSCQITSQTEVFLSRYKKQVVGITGTKGKSTTSSLLYHILSHNNLNCLFAGNIGIPVFDIIDDICDDTIVILELSCHQLENIKVSPSVSIFLNLYEEHLDHYGTFQKYANAKKNIYKNQTSEDYLFCNPNILPSKTECASNVVAIDIGDLPPNISENATQLNGEHNLFNIAAIYQVCKLFNISCDDIAKHISSFKPLAHRLEFLGNTNGVDYYDDSISTSAESTISAIKSVANVGTVLIGGMDRGINYSPLINYLLEHELDEVVFMSDAGKRIFDIVNPIQDKSVGTRFSWFPNLITAVEFAKKATKKGKACLLSPAAASYGEFKNFEERGDVFRKLVFENK